MKRNQLLAHACLLVAFLTAGCDSGSLSENIKYNQTKPKRISKTVYQQTGNYRYRIESEYEYDAKGRLTNIRQDHGFSEYIYNFEYVNKGRVSRITAPNNFLLPGITSDAEVIDVLYTEKNDLPERFVFNEEPLHSLAFTYKPSGQLEKSDYRNQTDTTDSGIDNIVYNPYMLFGMRSIVYSYNEQGMISAAKTIHYVDNCPSEETPCYQKNGQYSEYYNYQTVTGDTTFAIIDQPGSITTIITSENFGKPVIHQNQANEFYIEITYEEAICQEVFPAGFKIPSVYELSPCAE
ncbi:hypothetical protein GP5015_1510 [gamma proteobacterium HTCC5015]|nr:hypothetical protein GP5015_1510 [gamma proteobacterium HTCC5015]